MKNLKTLVIMFSLVFAITSCNSDDTPDDDVNDNLIVGTWKLTGLDGHIVQTLTTDGVSETTITDTNLISATTVRVINTDNTYTKTGGYIMHVSIESPNGSISTRDDELQTTAPGTWDKTDTTVTFNPSSSELEYTGEIMVLNSTTFKYKVVTEIVQNTDSGNVSLISTVINTYVRQ
jgi:hypothetical protein